MRRVKSIPKLIFIGLSFNLLVGAIFSLWQFIFLAFNLPFPVELWFGHFRYANFSSTLILLIFQLLFLIGMRFVKRDLALISLDESMAENLNISRARLHQFIFVSVSLGTFLVVAMFGAFSFLGLIFPIISRRLWFHRFDLKGELIVGSVFNGFAFCLIDLVCYSAPVYGAEIPMGLLSMIIGAVSLIIILWKSSNRFEILAKT